VNGYRLDNQGSIPSKGKASLFHHHRQTSLLSSDYYG